MGWNWLDGAVLGILAISTIAAIFEGLIGRSFPWSRWLWHRGGSFGVCAGCPVVRAMVRPTELAQGTAFLALFLGVLIAGAILGFLLRKIAQIAAWVV